jgi:hypothetical protein
MRWSGRARLVSCVCEADQLRMPPGCGVGAPSREPNVHAELAKERTWKAALGELGFVEGTHGC